jgi:hypothetical protein
MTTAEEILEDGINDGTYADITDQINVSTETAFFKAIVRFAEDYASERSRDELIKFIKWAVKNERKLRDAETAEQIIEIYLPNK